MIILSLSLLLYGFMYFESLTRQATSNPSTIWGSGQLAVVRLAPGEDLKRSLLDYATSNEISAGIVVSAVGSVKSLHLRLATPPNGDKPGYYHSSENFEIVSLVGTTEFNSTHNTSYGHFHMSVADQMGTVRGGHLMEGCLIHTTAEITLARLPHLAFHRAYDARSGYAELVVEQAAPGIMYRIWRAYTDGSGMLLRNAREQFCEWYSKQYATNSCPAVW